MDQFAFDFQLDMIRNWSFTFCIRIVLKCSTHFWLISEFLDFRRHFMHMMTQPWLIDKDKDFIPGVVSDQVSLQIESVD